MTNVFQLSKAYAEQSVNLKLRMLRSKGRPFHSYSSGESGIRVNGRSLKHLNRKLRCIRPRGKVFSMIMRRQFSRLSILVENGRK